jgi:hypothetical protein
LPLIYCGATLFSTGQVAFTIVAPRIAGECSGINSDISSTTADNKENNNNNIITSARHHCRPRNDDFNDDTFAAVAIAAPDDITAADTAACTLVVDFIADIIIIVILVVVVVGIAAVTVTVFIEAVRCRMGLRALHVPQPIAASAQVWRLQCSATTRARRSGNAKDSKGVKKGDDSVVVTALAHVVCIVDASVIIVDAIAVAVSFAVAVVRHVDVADTNVACIVIVVGVIVVVVCVVKDAISTCGAERNDIDESGAPRR